MEKKTRGRLKIEIKRIEDDHYRNTTFSKRKSGIFRKAEQLAALCDAEIAVIAFSNCGRLYKYANTTMNSTLSRYKKRLKLPYQIGHPQLNRVDRSETNTHVTFFRRKASLLKKANELAILCCADIAVIIFSRKGIPYTYTNTTMDSVLSRYNERSKELDQYEPNQADQSKICDLKSEIAELRLSIRQMKEKGNLECMSFEELERLEDELNERLSEINDKKEPLENSSIPVTITFE